MEREKAKPKQTFAVMYGADRLEARLGRRRAGPEPEEAGARAPPLAVPPPPDLLLLLIRSSKVMSKKLDISQAETKKIDPEIEIDRDIEMEIARERERNRVRGR